MRDTTLVSVVTPFYNTAAYLAECIESVLAQTHGHFEYLLLDNASTDGSGEIAARYVARDARIRLARNETLLTQTQNYNRALELVHPGACYVKIVQADDWLFPRCLAEMVALADEHPSVAIVSSLDKRGRTVCGECLLPEQRVLRGREACRLVLREDRFFFGSPTTVMYRADVVRARRPFFPEVAHFADTVAAFEILRDHDFGFVHQVLSYTRIREDSISGAAVTFDPEPLDKLIRIVRCGRLHLDTHEYEKRRRAVEQGYYRRLAAAWLRRREPAYWDWHRKGLATVGEVIDRRQLARAVVIELIAGVMPSGLRAALRPRSRMSATAAPMEDPR